jgi:hypothetical protein
MMSITRFDNSQVEFLGIELIERFANLKSWKASVLMVCLIFV